jgi:hypothetical protein
MAIDLPLPVPPVPPASPSHRGFPTARSPGGPHHVPINQLRQTRATLARSRRLTEREREKERRAKSTGASVRALIETIRTRVNRRTAAIINEMHRGGGWARRRRSNYSDRGGNSQVRRGAARSGRPCGARWRVINDPPREYPRGDSDPPRAGGRGRAGTGRRRGGGGGLDWGSSISRINATVRRVEVASPAQIQERPLAMCQRKRMETRRRVTRLFVYSTNRCTTRRFRRGRRACNGRARVRACVCARACARAFTRRVANDLCIPLITSMHRTVLSGDHSFIRPTCALRYCQRRKHPRHEHRAAP